MKVDSYTKVVLTVIAVALSALAINYIIAPQPAVAAAPAQVEELQIRVVDVGAGLCTVTSAPSGTGRWYMVYDAGSSVWQFQECFNAIEDFVEGNVIDLLIVSHPDTDHLSNADDLLANFQVRQIIR